MSVGILIATQLAWWQANFGISWLTFGRLRPLHTNAVIFAFAGNAIFAGIYYSTQRLLKARMFNDTLSKIHFWGWQLIIILAAVTLPLGISVSKEYAELEWPIDILITVIWVIFAINLFGTIARRREKHIYVAIWFYIATVLTVALLHLINSLAIPVNLIKSYSVFAGVQDALVQWWYGHNAVAFFLTTPFLGLMYYFVPKAVNRPIYSYRLSIVHFWSLVFLYIWAGPHHLLNTALPDWAQTMGVVFSVMLLAPSWGGMINGLLTLRGAWDKVRSDPILKFFVVGITFYGMSTFEGPLLSIREVNALAHYTDWIIAHVHGGALGWNGFITFGMIYYLIPKLWKTEVWSKRLMMLHFWMGTLGIVIYIVAMWTAGITQGLMWRALKPDGSLQYPDFVETVIRLVPFYWMRVLGGTLYLAGLLVMVYNVARSIMQAKRSNADLSDVVVRVAVRELQKPHNPARGWHYALECKTFIFSSLALVAVLAGTVVELVPMIAVQSNVTSIASVKPYTALELEGRDLYIREGCYNCHSQMIRTLPEEVLRYGPNSKAGEFIYDRPFQFGSKRTGPDLQRVGGKYPDFWHFRHMLDPRSTSTGSLMPAYPWLYDTRLDTSMTRKKLSVLAQLGTPYSKDEINGAVEDLEAQASAIAVQLTKEGVPESPGLKDKEIIALISYLQRLGTDYKKELKK
jgi:cytochrome c oxidase cbb3-type subunit I/II